MQIHLETTEETHSGHPALLGKDQVCELVAHVHLTEDTTRVSCSVKGDRNEVQ
jgi:hypothetical protein